MGHSFTDSILPPYWPFPLKNKSNFQLSLEVSERFEYMSCGNLHAELALLGVLVCTTLATFSGHKNVGIFLVDTNDKFQNPFGAKFEYIHDTNRDFASLASDAIAVIQQDWKILKTLVETEIAVSINGPSSLLNELSLVFEFSRVNGHLQAEINGIRSKELDGWLGWFWQGLEFQAEQFIQMPKYPISKIDLLPRTQLETLCEINATAREYCDDKNITVQFCEQVAIHKDEIAVFGLHNNYTWSEIAKRAGQFAAWLISCDVSHGKVVAVITERHELNIIAFLGIAMAGAVYLPISSDYPTERILHLIEDSCAAVTIVIDSVPNLEVPFTSWESIPFEKFDVVTPISRCGDDALYLIYTSGSTGKPKGVLVSHRNVARLVAGKSYIDWLPNDRVALAATPIFDAVTFEIWGALINGLPLVCIPKAVFLDPQLLASTWLEKKVTLAFLSTALFNFIATHYPQAFSSLRCLLFGGEIASTNLVRLVRQVNPELQLHHVYGPTENTTFSTYYPIKEVGERIPIGRPIGNSSAWIVDELLRPLPIGANGQLLLGGDGIALGYINSPELNEKYFISIPPELSSTQSSLGYLSGDWARWTPDYEIDFLGRIDNQIKIQGYRVELDEIRMHILSFLYVTEVEVLPGDSDEDGYRSVFAYFCAQQQVDLQALRHHLINVLPYYMIPSKLYQIEAFPLTLQGKVDKHALEQMFDQHVIVHSKDFNDARHEMDQRLIKIWRSILNIENINIDDHFASLGGHSMLLLDMAERLFEEFGVELQLRDLVHLQSIRLLADHLIAQTHIEPRLEATVNMSQHEFGLLPTQLQLYLGQQIAPESAQFHIPVLLRLTGPLNYLALQKAWDELISAHEALRLSFHVGPNGVIQRISESINNKLFNRYIKSTELNEYVTQATKQSFDLSSPYNIRGELLIIDDNFAYLLIVCHHIIIDGISLSLILQELAQRYQNLPQLGMRLSWREAVLSNIKVLSKVQPDVDFFVCHLKGNRGPIDLKRFPKREALSSKDMADIETRLVPKKLKIAINEFCHKYAVTPNIPILACFNLLLWCYGAETDINIAIPSSGRWHFTHARTIGMFVNTLILRTKWSEKDTFIELVSELNKQHRDVLSHEHAPLDSVLDALNIRSHQLFNVMFNMQSLPISAIHFGNQISVSMENISWNSAKYDLALRVEDDGENFTLGLEYRYSILKTQKKATQFVDRLLAILDEFLNYPNLPVTHALSLRERYRELPVQTSSVVPIPNVLDKFLQYAVKQPDHIAVSDIEEQLSYETLHERVKTIAAQLKKNGITKGMVVGICMPHSVNTIAAMLACWRVGAIFLSLDEEWQNQRINYCCEVAQVRAAIVETQIIYDDIPHIFMSELLNNPLQQDFDLPEVCFNASDIAYVIFTSGSTGQPKGVPITHANLTNYAVWFQQFGELRGVDRACVLTSLSFDLSFTAIWPFLWKGSSIHIAPPLAEVGVNNVLNFIINRGITCLKLTPSLLSIMISEMEVDSDRLSSLRLLVIGGEAPRRSDLKRVNQILPAVQLVNHYGPTETTIGCAAMFIDKDILYESDGAIPIGKPIDNMYALILDDQQFNLPTGLIGELCVTGAGVSPGYLGITPELNDRFFLNQALSPYMIYKTGDAAYYDSKERLILQGRIDRQVKIRGYRIDLAEVEYLAETIEGVERASAITVMNPQGDLEICLFWQGWLEGSATLRLQIVNKFPAFIVPTHLKHIEKLPVTHNGKVDYSVLSLIFSEASSKQQAGVCIKQKSKDIVEDLRDLWLDLTGIYIDKPNISLFEAGGNSLQILRLFTEVTQRFGSVVTLPEIFSKATLNDLGGLLRSRTSISITPCCEAFSASTRFLSRFAQRYRLSLNAVLLGIVAQAAYENVEGEQISLLVRIDSKDHLVSFNFMDFTHVHELLVYASKALESINNSSQDFSKKQPICTLQFDYEDIPNDRSVLVIVVNSDGVSGQAYAPLLENDFTSKLLQRVGELVNQLQ
ncbi:amino acid adenylation domain-containing protein [Acinetobacter calcoaceticus]